MSQSSANNLGGAQDASKNKKGGVYRPRAKLNGPQTGSGTSGTGGTAEESGPPPPETASFEDEVGDSGSGNGPTAALTDEGPQGWEVTPAVAMRKHGEQLGKRVRGDEGGYLPDTNEEPDNGSGDGQSSQKRRGGGAGGSDDDGRRGGGIARRKTTARPRRKGLEGEQRPGVALTITVQLGPIAQPRAFQWPPC